MRIASPELLLWVDPLPHVICFPPGLTGGSNMTASKAETDQTPSPAQTLRDFANRVRLFDEMVQGSWCSSCSLDV